jgi:hypothetical protein
MLFELPDNVQVMYNEIEVALDSHARGCGFFTPRRTERERREAIALLVSEQIRDAVADGILPIPEDKRPAPRKSKARANRLAHDAAHPWKDAFREMQDEFPQFEGA